MSRNVRVRRREVIATAFARSVTLPLVIAHARPSFFLLDRGHQRRLLVEQMAGKLGTHVRIAQRVAEYWPADFPDPSVRSATTQWLLTPFGECTP